MNGYLKQKKKPVIVVSVGSIDYTDRLKKYHALVIDYSGKYRELEGAYCKSLAPGDTLSN